MKKIFVFLAPIFILAIIYSCSKEHQSPTFSQYEKTSEPTDVIATYDGDNDTINVVWRMEDTAGVVDYLVAWSDSNVFDATFNKSEQFVKKTSDTELKNEITLNASDVLKKMNYYADEDSFIVYFTVSAVYTNDEFLKFIGPRAVVDRNGTYADSALILRKE